MTLSKDAFSLLPLDTKMFGLIKEEKLGLLRLVRPLIDNRTNKSMANEFIRQVFRTEFSGGLGRFLDSLSLLTSSFDLGVIRIDSIQLRESFFDGNTRARDVLLIRRFD